MSFSPAKVGTCPSSGVASEPLTNEPVAFADPI